MSKEFVRTAVFGYFAALALSILLLVPPAVDEENAYILLGVPGIAVGLPLLGLAVVGVDRLADFLADRYGEDE